MSFTILKSLPPETMIGGIPGVHVEIAENVFQISEYCFFRMGHRFLNGDITASIHLVAVYWAQGVSAMIRLAKADISLDQSLTSGTPPSEMLLEPNIVTYGQLMECARTGDYGRYLESAAYDVNGRYLHRVISVGKHFSFYFRNNEDDMNECPFAVEYRIR